nr:hypothetical protein CFP56_09017 [Quercus suber]
MGKQSHFSLRSLFKGQPSPARSTLSGREAHTDAAAEAPAELVHIAPSPAPTTEPSTTVIVRDFTSQPDASVQQAPEPAKSTAERASEAPAGAKSDTEVITSVRELVADETATKDPPPNTADRSAQAVADSKNDKEVIEDVRKRVAEETAQNATQLEAAKIDSNAVKQTETIVQVTQATPATNTISKSKVYPQSDGRFSEDLPKDISKSRQSYITRKTNGPVGVADRVRKLEQQTQDQKHHTQKSVNRVGQAVVPIVYPLHVKRFQRRTVEATPVRPETPIYQNPVEHTPYLHAPQPKRASIPYPKTPDSVLSLATSRPNTRTIDTTRGDHDASITRNFGYGRRRSRNFAMRPTSRPAEQGRQRISPAAHLHRTREMCIRHGRKPKTHGAISKQPTNDMTEKSRSGAYIPVGLRKRRQIEATSPWAVTNGELTNKKGSHIDVCPDCIAELALKRKEINEGTTSLLAAQHGGSPSPASPSPMTALKDNMQPGVSSQPQAVSPLTSAELTKHLKLVQHHTFQAYQITGHSLVALQNISDEVDAAIFRRERKLERVSLNPCLTSTPSLILQKLSKQLLDVSRALEAAESTHEVVSLDCAEDDKVKAAAATKGLDVPSVAPQVTFENVTMADASTHEQSAAVNNSRAESSSYPVLRPRASRPPQSILGSKDFDAVVSNVSPEARLVHRQTLPELSSLLPQRNLIPAPSPTQPAMIDSSLGSVSNPPGNPLETPLPATTVMSTLQRALTPSVDMLNGTVSTTLAPIATVTQPYFHAPSARLAQVKLVQSITETLNLPAVAAVANP